MPKSWASSSGLAPVNVTPDRIIRIDVGLRPFRPAGFVVRNETLGDKTIVHNYGHGGGGVTLCWGTAALALEQAPPVRHCAVLGCGAVGLATARLAQERGMQVTIYAAALPPETTSNVAGAQWWPSYVYDEDALTPRIPRTVRARGPSRLPPLSDPARWNLRRKLAAQLLRQRHTFFRIAAR